MAITVYRGEEQLELIKTLLNDSTLKTTLAIPSTVKGIPNLYEIMFQSPYFLIPDFLPTVFITIQETQVVDEQYNQADEETIFQIYYAMKFTANEQTVITMYQRLEAIADRILLNRRNQEPIWYSLSIPSIEVNNEINEFYARSDRQIAIGRVQFTTRSKNPWRE